MFVLSRGKLILHQRFLLLQFPWRSSIFHLGQPLLLSLLSLLTLCLAARSLQHVLEVALFNLREEGFPIFLDDVADRLAVNHLEDHVGLEPSQSLEVDPEQFETSVPQVVADVRVVGDIEPLESLFQRSKPCNKHVGQGLDARDVQLLDLVVQLLLCSGYLKVIRLDVINLELPSQHLLRIRRRCTPPFSTHPAEQLGLHGRHCGQLLSVTAT
mmetsp:Transcript_127279/g.231327  ORF Transcript_127279/g.231327 Transcript_127279/m.231327 type:complete len:213 (-) Transcript_127279:1670-2308(-)